MRRGMNYAFEYSHCGAEKQQEKEEPDRENLIIGIVNESNSDIPTLHSSYDYILKSPRDLEITVEGKSTLDQPSVSDDMLPTHVASRAI
jgi:hypothetical protein